MGYTTLKTVLKGLGDNVICVDSDDIEYTPAEMIERVRECDIELDRNLLRRKADVQGGRIWVGSREVFICRTKCITRTSLRDILENSANVVLENVVDSVTDDVLLSHHTMKTSEIIEALYSNVNNENTSSIYNSAAAKTLYNHGVTALELERAKWVGVLKLSMFSMYREQAVSDQCGYCFTYMEGTSHDDDDCLGCPFESICGKTDNPLKYLRIVASEQRKLKAPVTEDTPEGCEVAKYTVTSDEDCLEGRKVQTSVLFGGIGYTIAQACKGLLMSIGYVKPVNADDIDEWWTVLTGTDWVIRDVGCDIVFQDGELV